MLKQKRKIQVTQELFLYEIKRLLPRVKNNSSLTYFFQWLLENKPAATLHLWLHFLNSYKEGITWKITGCDGSISWLPIFKHYDSIQIMEKWIMPQEQPLYMKYVVAHLKTK